MTATFKTPGQEATAGDAARLLASGTDPEIVLSLLREKGFDKIESIKALVGAGGMPLREAKVVVHNSEAWRDVHDRDERFQEELRQAAEKVERGHSLHPL